MKTFTRYLIPAASLAVMLPPARAEDAAPIKKKEMRVLVEHGQDEHPDRVERRVIHVGGHQEMESVTFLGVETRSADSALTDQLGLPAGTGLVVQLVVPGSAAANVLKKNDLLTKFDDQILIDQRQLSVLVRSKKEGDEVKLTYVRSGQTSTTTVKLGKHDSPKMSFMEEGPGFHFRSFPFGENGLEIKTMKREDLDRVLSLMDQAPGAPHASVRVGHKAPPGLRSTTVSTANSNMVFSDEKGSLDLTIKEGKKTLVAKDAKGAQLFSGPVNTPEERKALPGGVRERLDKLEGMQDFSFETDAFYKDGVVAPIPPMSSKISQSIPADEERVPPPRSGSMLF